MVPTAIYAAELPILSANRAEAPPRRLFWLPFSSMLRMDKGLDFVQTVEKHDEKRMKTKTSYFQDANKCIAN